MNYHVTFSNADDIFSSIQQANLNDRQVNSLMKSMSHEIKEDLEPSSTPKVNQVAQSTGHAYQSELFIAQENLMSLSHRLQSDNHINTYRKTKQLTCILFVNKTSSEHSTFRIKHVSHTAVLI